MPALDKFHQVVKNALIKDGWTITDEPLRLEYGGMEYAVDFGAEKLIAAKKDGRQIAVEVKSFLSDSLTYEFHQVVGQFVDYRFLSSEARIKGLVRLLSIALRVLCLLEFSVRKALSEQGGKLAGIYRGNPKRATANPTAEMMLKAFEWVSLTEVELDGAKHRCLSPLSAVQERILELLDLPVTIYLALTG